MNAHTPHNNKVGGVSISEAAKRIAEAAKKPAATERPVPAPQNRF